MSFREKKCEHVLAIDTVRLPSTYECAECVQTGDSWVHLRTCQSCGITLCCDSSPNQHATKHALGGEHHVVISAEPGERWMWCYAHKKMTHY